MNYTIANLEKDYELELERVVDEIGKSGAKSVLVQLPDGLKPWGVCIVDYLSERCNASVLRGDEQQVTDDGKESMSIKIWLGSCFGACDLPASSTQVTGDGLQATGDDLVVQFGHAAW